MKLAIFAALCLSCIAAPAAWSSVTVTSVIRSDQNPRITILADGKPLANAKVEVYGNDGLRRTEMFANEQGVVVLPVLPAGQYHVAANGPDGLGADLYLKLSGHTTKHPTEFSLTLYQRPPEPPSIAERIATATHIETPEMLRMFSGTVTDPTGAGVAKAHVNVQRQAALDGKYVARLTADKFGRFTANLPYGKYVAVIMVPGFSPRIYVFETSDTAVATVAHIRLNIAPAST
jgi:Carboxypeptidase regulatory-like domain